MHKNIRHLLAASICIHMGLNILAPVYAIYVEQINGELIHASASLGFYAILRGILYFFFAQLKDAKVSHKPILVIGYLMYVIGYLGYIFIYAPYQLFLVLGWIAIADSLLNPAWSAVLASSLQTGKERETYSKFYGYRSIFEGIGALIGGIAIVTFGFTWTFVIMAGFALAASLFSLRLKINEKE
jgi:predicted MFS family arabinose efflux permease